MAKVSLIGNAGTGKKTAVYSVTLDGSPRAYVVAGREIKYMSERRGKGGRMLRRWLPVVQTALRRQISDAVREYQIEEVRKDDRSDSASGKASD